MQCSEGNQRNFDRNRKLQLALFLLEHPYSVHWWWEKDARRQIINEQNWRMIFQRPLRQLRLRPLWNRNWAAQRGRFLHSLHNVTPSMSNLNIGHFLSRKPLNKSCFTVSPWWRKMIIDNVAHQIAISLSFRLRLSVGETIWYWRWKWQKISQELQMLSSSLSDC